MFQSYEETHMTFQLNVNCTKYCVVNHWEQCFRCGQQLVKVMKVKFPENVLLILT